MGEKLSRSENGQNLVVYAIFIIVILALAGLIIDGGFGLANRRQAQNAADAGALAGANALCAGDTALAYTLANDYAINKNDADTADVILSSEEITVTASITQDTFLARVFGADVITSTAIASAGCCTPCIGTVLPTAWNCQPPAGVVITSTATYTCTINYGTLSGGGPIYLFMDSESTSKDYYCQSPPNSGQPANSLDCDWNNDGTDEIFAGGNRSWLDLNGGGGGASELSYWVEHGYGPVKPHTWYSGQPGTENSVFISVEDFAEGKVVLLPVFDSYCNVADPATDPQCANLYHPGVDIINYGTNNNYFHVISYAALKITCVVKAGEANNYDPILCPGRALAEQANPQINWNSIKTIEGYFIEATDPDLGGCCNGPDLGAHTVYLKP